MAYEFEASGKLKALTTEQLAAADADSSIIVLNRGTLDDDTPYWAYIAVKPSRYKEFMQLTAERKPMRLGEYGNVLQFGFDAQVPPAVQAAMKQEYGFDENYLAMRAKIVEEAQLNFLKQQEDQRIGDIVAMLKKQKDGA